MRQIAAGQTRASRPRTARCIDLGQVFRARDAAAFDDACGDLGDDGIQAHRYVFLAGPLGTPEQFRQYRRVLQHTTHRRIRKRRILLLNPLEDAILLVALEV